MMESARFLAGQFLLAMPGIGDPRFEQAVIAMCGHDEDGAIGIGIGARIDGLGLHDVLEQFDIEPGAAPDAPVHLGGPVEPRRGFVLHSSDWGGQDTVDVAGRWALSGTIDVLRAIAEGRGRRAGSSRSAMPAGARGSSTARCCATAGSTSPATTRLIYDTDADDRWAAGFASAGIDPRLLAPRRARPEPSARPTASWDAH